MPSGDHISLHFPADFLHMLDKPMPRILALNPHSLAAPVEGEKVIVLVVPEKKFQERYVGTSLGHPPFFRLYILILTPVASRGAFWLASPRSPAHLFSSWWLFLCWFPWLRHLGIFLSVCAPGDVFKTFSLSVFRPACLACGAQSPTLTRRSSRFPWIEHTGSLHVIYLISSSTPLLLQLTLCSLFLHWRNVGLTPSTVKSELPHWRAQLNALGDGTIFYPMHTALSWLHQKWHLLASSLCQILKNINKIVRRVLLQRDLIGVKEEIKLVSLPMFLLPRDISLSNHSNPATPSLCWHHQICSSVVYLVVLYFSKIRLHCKLRGRNCNLI